MFLITLIILFLSPQIYSTKLYSKFSPHDSTYDICRDQFPLTKNSLGFYSDSTFVFDESCISVVRTNSLLEVDCQLPSRCGVVKHRKISKGYFGQEVIVCYSFHPIKNHGSSELFRISYEKTDCLINHDVDQATTFYNVQPLDFFEHFIFQESSGIISMYPRVCLDHFTKDSDDLPSTVLINEVGSGLCVEHTVHTELNCQPQIFENFSSIIRSFDFPVAYYGNPYELTTHTRYRNQDPLVSEYALKSQSTYLYSIIDSIPFVSQAPLSKLVTNSYYSSGHYIYYSELLEPPKKERFCYPIQSIYKNPLNSIVSVIVSAIEPVFLSILEFVESNLERFFKLLVKAIAVFLPVISQLFSALISPEVISALVCSIAVYLYFRDVYLLVTSFIVFLVVFNVL